MSDVDARTVLRLIAEGYPAMGYEDRYVAVENPDYAPDNGKDPWLVFDTDTLYPMPELDQMEADIKARAA